MKTYKLHIHTNRGNLAIFVQARYPDEARRIAERQYGAGSLANGGYATEVH